MKTIVITGGAGFLGSNLAHDLAELGQYRIVIVDMLEQGNQWQNLVRVPADEIVSPANFFYWLEDYGDAVEAIIHLGGVSASTEQNLGLMMESNHQYPLLLWRWCANHGKRFFYASSAEVYGAGELGFDDTLDITALRQLRPLNPNGWSKKLFDLYAAQAAGRGDKLPTQWVGLRFFNLYGPNEYHKGAQRSVLLQIFEDASKGIPAKLFKSAHPNYPDGGQKRDFMYVKDAVKVMRWLLENPQVSGIFNIGTGTARSFNELAQVVFGVLGRSPAVKYVDMPSHVVERQYQYLTEAKLDRLRAAGYQEAFATLEEGAADYIEHFLKKADPYL
jgi:ADP-L-glycero-D-manno-heptose 6-epimerase